MSSYKLRWRFMQKNDEKLMCRKEKWFEFCFFIRILESVAPNVSSSTPLSRSKLNPTMSTSSHVITIQVTISTRSSFYKHRIEKTWKAYSLWKLVYNLLNQLSNKNKSFHPHLESRPLPIVSLTRPQFQVQSSIKSFCFKGMFWK